MWTTWKKKFMYQETKKGNQLNDKNTVSYKEIFDEILNREGLLTSSVCHYPYHSECARP